MKILNWNIEHMNSWWKGGEADPPILKQSSAKTNFSPAIKDVPSLARRVGNVIKKIDPDVVTIQEAAGMPELVSFFKQFVNNNDWKILRGAGGGQALAVAANMDKVSKFQPGENSVGDIDLSKPYKADVDANLEIEDNKFARLPQVVNITMHGKDFILINNHLKSKFVKNGESLFNAGGESKKSFFEDALKARRRISGEAFRIREFIDALLTKNPDELIIVTGDLNDGAGADFFEKNFLTHSVVDRIFGSIFNIDKQLTHVLFHGRSTDFTAQFHDFITNETRDLVLDHIGLSPAIVKNFNWQGRVAVLEYENEIDNSSGLEERDKLPSDHRPVVAELTPK